MATVCSCALWAESSKNPPSERYFQTEIPQAYRAKVKAFVTTSLIAYPHLLKMSLRPEEAKTAYQRDALTFLKHVQEPSQNQREWHQRLVTVLRQLSKGEQEAPTSLSQEVAVFVDAFAIWLFSGVDVSHTYRTSFEREINLQESPQPLNIATHLRDIYSSFHKNPKYVGYDTHGEYLMDTLMEGNVPLVVVRLEKGQKSVPLMRTGTMVRDLDLEQVRIAEEYLLYLEALNRRGKKHLYVTLMRYGFPDEEKERIEILRSQTIVALESSQKAARIISLDKNSDFYLQKGKFKNLNIVEEFKSQFLVHLLAKGPEAKYYWSKHLDPIKWKSTLGSIVEEVHQKNFASAPQLTPAERTAFIEISYMKIIHAAIQQLDVDAVNVACRFGIDRGASLIGLIHFDHLLQDSSASGENLNALIAFVFGPGLFFHDRPIHDARIEQLQLAAWRLQMSR